MTPGTRLFRRLHKTLIDAVQAGRADQAYADTRRVVRLAAARSATSETGSETASRTDPDARPDPGARTLDPP